MPSKSILHKQIDFLVGKRRGGDVASASMMRVFATIILPFLFFRSNSILMLLKSDPQHSSNINMNNIFGVGVSALTTTTKNAIVPVRYASHSFSLSSLSPTNANNIGSQLRFFSKGVQTDEQEQNLENIPDIQELGGTIRMWSKMKSLNAPSDASTFLREAPSRAITRRLATTMLLSIFVVGLPPAIAFDNGITDMPLYRTQPKNPGTRPALGLQSNGKLAKCDYAPNCFSTSGNESHLLKLWKPKAGSNAMGELLETIEAYPPGQARIDKGGFSIITASANYLYVQFESLKIGFIDDVEFAVTDGEVQVRSSSRIGFLDLGVNAKRLNWISAELRVKGWTAPKITEEDYPDSFPMMPFTYDDYIRSVLSPLECPISSDPLTCGGPSLKPTPLPK